MSQKSFRRLASCEIESTMSIFKTAMLIDQLKANLDQKILFGKGTHQFDLEIGEMGKKHVWERGFHILFWSEL